MQLVFSSTFNAPYTYRKIRYDDYCSIFWESFWELNTGMSECPHGNEPSWDRLPAERRFVFSSTNRYAMLLRLYGTPILPRYRHDDTPSKSSLFLLLFSEFAILYPVVSSGSSTRISGRAIASAGRRGDR